MPLPSSLPRIKFQDPANAPGLNWGILGPGWIASQFAESLNSLTSSRIAAVGSRSRERSEDFARKFGDAGTQSYASYSQVMEDPQVDVVYIAVPHSGHHALALEAIAHGKHVLVEKPMSINLELTEQIIEAARASKVFVMEALWTRCLPVGQIIKRVLDSGMLGQVLAVNADFASLFEVDYSSRIYNPELAGGALLDLGIYPVALSAMSSPARRVLHASGRLAATGVDATVSAVLENEDESRTTLYTSIESISPNRAWISGTVASLEVESPIYAPSRLVLRGPDGALLDAQDFSETSPELGLGWEAAHVARCIGNGAQQSELVPWKDTLSIARTLHALKLNLNHSEF